MAATVEEGTAPKLVLVNAGKQFPIASVNRDSRKDGTLSPSVCVFNKHIKFCCEGFWQAGGKPITTVSKFTIGSSSMAETLPRASQSCLPSRSRGC